MTVIGAYSEYICLPEENLTAVPDEVDSADALSLIFSFSAHYPLEKASEVRQKIENAELKGKVIYDVA